MKKMPIVIGSALLLSLVPALGQTPAPPAPRTTQPSTPSNLPVCSDSDANRVRNGQPPATPCRADTTQTGQSSTTKPDAPAPSTPSTTPGTTPRP